MADSVKERLMRYAAEVEGRLEGCLKDKAIPVDLQQSMEYSLLAGGKRLRPVLCALWAELCGMPRSGALPFACGLELIHTYSLVHDDLPAMDDDDLRRGKPSNHKKFGEATAILAGDGLLTEAFSLMLEADVAAERKAKAAAVIARAAGPSGMVGGQAVDMAYTGRDDVNLAELKRMHSMKTGALIRAACESGALLAGAGEEDVLRAARYGAEVGVAFQIADDILDIVGDEAVIGKPVGSDQAGGKSTYPALVGLEESRSLAYAAADSAVESLSPYFGEGADFLRELARYIVERVN